MQNLKGSLKNQLEAENNLILQGELEKIEQMKKDLESQVSAIESEKQALKFLS